jgi:ABC-2 type transport system permease protein
MDAVAEHCDRALLIESGGIAAMGRPAEVIQAYEALPRERPRVVAALPSARRREEVIAEREPFVAFDADPEPVQYGPVAVGGDVRHFLSLVRALAAAEFRLRYMDSALSYLWCLMRPLMLFGILYLIFSHVLRFGGQIAHYPVVLLTSVVLWTFFAETAATSVTSLVARANVLTKSRMPRLAVPLAVVATAMINLAVNFVAVVVFMLVAGVTPRASWLALPLLVAVLAVFTTGVSMLLAGLYVRFRDVGQIWSLAQYVLFYGSPIFYVATFYPDNVERVLASLPIAAILTEARHILIDPAAPSAASLVGGAPFLLVPLALVAATFALGLAVFVHESQTAAEHV